MALAMTRPTTRRDSRQYQFKRRTPAKLLASRRGQKIVIQVPGHGPVEATVGEVVKLSLRTTDAAAAKHRTAAIAQQLEELAGAAVALPVALSHKQQVALAGEAYRRLVAAREDDPGCPAQWRLFAKAFAVMGDAEQDTPAAAVRHVGPLVDLLLDEKRLQADAATRTSLIELTRVKMVEAGGTLARRATGDYTSDPTLQTIPEYLSPTSNQPKRSLTALFNAWAAEAEKTGTALATAKRYRGVFNCFAAFLGHDDRARVTRQEIIAYKVHRLHEQGRKPKSVKDGDLAGLKSVFGWGVVNGYLADNPAAGVTLKVSKNKRPGYSPEAALALVRAGTAYQQNERELPQTAWLKRWGFLLLAFSGARAGEIAQLRKRDIHRNSEGHWGMTLHPEAGTVKGGRARWVPFHPQIIEQGFLRFVESVDDEYLFRNVREDGTRRVGLATIKNRLSTFAVSVLAECGLHDPKVSPIHGWRHYFITRSRAFRLDQEKRRMITGHSGKGVDETEYGEPAGLCDEIIKLPHYPL